MSWFVHIGAQFGVSSLSVVCSRRLTTTVACVIVCMALSSTQRRLGARGGVGCRHVSWLVDVGSQYGFLFFFVSGLQPTTVACVFVCLALSSTQPRLGPRGVGCRHVSWFVDVGTQCVSRLCRQRFAVD